MASKLDDLLQLHDDVSMLCGAWRQVEEFSKRINARMGGLGKASYYSDTMLAGVVAQRERTEALLAKIAASTGELSL